MLKPVSHSGTWIISDAVCAIKLKGFVDYRSWMMNQTIRWGDKWVQGNLAEVTGGPACVSPTVNISPAGPLILASGSQQQFSGTASTAGIGTIATYAWTLNGLAVGSQSTWSGTFSQSGTHAVTLSVTNTAGLSAAKSVSVTIPGDEPPPPPPSGGGGSTELRQTIYGVYCYFISYDGGQTWINTGYCFFL